MRALAKVGEQKASKVGVHTLITRDELVGEGETRHQATLLQPEDGGERPAEEDTLDSSEGNETLSEGRTLFRDPSKGPVSLFLDAWDGLDSIKEMLALNRIFNVGVDEQRVCLRVDVLPSRRKGVTVSFVISIRSRTLCESRRL